MPGPVTWVATHGVGTISASDNFFFIRDRLQSPKYPGVNGKLLLMLHGAGQDAHGVFADTTSAAVIRDAVAAGWAVLGIDANGTQNWGAQESANRIDAALTWVSTNFAVPVGRIWMYSISMGGLTTLNWADTNVSKVAAWAGMIPAIDIKDLHDRNPIGVQPFIQAAYGGSAGFASAEPTYNPSRIPATFTFPKRIWYSSDDPICLPGIITTFAAASPNSSTVNTGAQGHSLNGVTASSVFSWLQAQP